MPRRRLLTLPRLPARDETMNRVCVSLVTGVLLLIGGCKDRADVDQMHPDSTYTPESAPIAVDSGALPVIPDSAQNNAQMIAPGVDIDSIPDMDRFLVFGLKRIGFTRAEIARTLGPADSTRSAAVENRHVPGQIDSVHHVYYRDAEIDVYAMPTGEMISAVKVKSNRLLRLPTVQIGMPLESREVRHSCSVCEVEHGLLLEGDGARVSSVTFSYYVD